MNTDELDFPQELPPTEPTNERVVQGEDAFAAECMALARGMIKGDDKLGTPVITQSDRWGLVWRADFEVAGKDYSPRVNRMICWRTPDGALLIGMEMWQDVPPLHPPE